MLHHNLFLAVNAGESGETAVRRSGDCETAVIGNSRSWAIDLEGKIALFLHSKGLSAGAKVEEAGQEEKTKSKEADESDEEAHHCWSDGCRSSSAGGGGRAIANGEEGEDSHYRGSKRLFEDVLMLVNVIDLIES